MIHPILTHPDPMLRRTSTVVGPVTDATRVLMEDMLETMYDAMGRGLAAIQIGIPLRLVVVDVGWKEGPRAPLVLVDPAVVWASDTLVAREERCLSIPDTPREVRRPDRVRVTYRDRLGKPAAIQADGILATALQHEIDHLDGVLIIDRGGR